MSSMIHPRSKQTQKTYEESTFSWNFVSSAFE